jgi:glycosyltransferase involved in cell wall biosynthesis
VSAPKKKLLIYSDCLVFGGADMLVAHLLGDEDLRRSWDCRFVYRGNAAFEAAVSSRLSKLVDCRPVSLPDRLAWIEALETAGTPLPFVLAAKALFRLLDPFFFAYDVLRLRAAFSEYGADVVHVNDGGYPGSLGCRAAAVAAKLGGSKVAFAVHNQARPFTLPGDVFDPVIDFLVGRCADAFVTATKIAQDALAKRLPREKMRLIQDGVATPSLRADAASARRALGVPAQEPAFAFVAFFEERKGHRVLVEAAKRLERRGIPGRFILVGDGGERAGIEEAVRLEGLSDRFSFLGYRPDAADVVNACDALVLPSVHSEDMPLIILDAMALGKPVVSTRLAGIPEEVEHGVTGLLAEPGDPEGLADALELLAGDASLRNRLGQAGRARFLARFEKSLMCAGYRALYGELAA